MKKSFRDIFWNKRWKKILTGLLAILIIFSMVPQIHASYFKHQHAKIKQEWLDNGGVVRRTIFRETGKTIDGVIESPVDELDIAFRVFKVDDPKGVLPQDV